MKIGTKTALAALATALAAACTADATPALPRDVGALKAVGPYLASTRTREVAAGCDVSRMVTPADAPWRLRTTFSDCAAAKRATTRVELEDTSTGALKKVFDLEEDRMPNRATTLQFAAAPHGGVPDLVLLDASCASPTGEGCGVGWIYRYDAKPATYRAYFAFGHARMWRNDDYLLTRSDVVGGKSEYQLFTAHPPPPAGDGGDGAIQWHNGLLALIRFDPKTGACEVQAPKAGAMTVLAAVPAALQRFCTADFR